MNPFDRAYINLPKIYDNMKDSNLDPMALIIAVAKANPEGDGNTHLYNMETHEIYEKRTKIFIVQKTKKYILGMHETFSECENMATFVSLRQFRNLIKSFYYEKKRISCYGLVYLYVIYTLLQGKSSEAAGIIRYLTILHDIILVYFENNPDDQLAVFFDGCYEPIRHAIEARNTMLENTLLPLIPRNQPQEDE